MTMKSEPVGAKFQTIGEIFVNLAEMLKPAEELTVSEAASKYRYVYEPGAYVGPWLNSTVPYMREPMDTFTSRVYSGEVMVAPAQCGKTDSLVINTVAYSVKVEPLDMMVVCPTNTAARDFSIRRIDRLHRHSEAIGAMLVPGSSNDNTFDKSYRSGMLLTLSWPTPTELAGKPIPRVVLTDRDRMVDDVDGDGEPFDLAAKRTTTFGSYAMTAAESSPSRPVEDLKWIPSSPHEAPPATGILALYNRGDRRRWYWPCPECQRYFEGEFTMLTWTSKTEMPRATNKEIGETVRMSCPFCSHKIHPDDRYEMNLWGTWVKDGQAIDKDGRVFGAAPRTDIASFWLKGVAAAFTNWKKLVAGYLDALDEFERNGSEEALKKFYNNDLAEPYYPKSTENLRLPEVMKANAEKGLQERMVPTNVRFLVATIDVQKNMFRVNVYGILPGRPFDTLVVDRYDVRKSLREDDDGERTWVKPHAHLEDWYLLEEAVMAREYPLDDGSGRMMGIKITACDSGGREGVTSKAYDFYRHLRDKGLAGRFILVKGDGKPGNPRARIHYPDSNRRDVKAIARGDVPVLVFNSNMLKDDLNGRLDSLVPGAGMFRFPDWMPDEFYAEMCAEIRGPKGWENPSGLRNEDWDLSYYMIGVCISELIRVEKIDWQSPPGWAKAADDGNDLVREPEAAPRFARRVNSEYDFAALGKAIA